jgi:hypothetical protein
MKKEVMNKEWVNWRMGLKREDRMGMYKEREEEVGKKKGMMMVMAIMMMPMDLEGMDLKMEYM